MNITVYTKPRCIQCDAVKRHLDRREMSYQAIDVTVDSDARATLQSLGYMAVPVVVIDGQWHTGYRPELLVA